MHLLSQPLDGQLGEYLRENLKSRKFNKLNIAVAFAKNSGVLRLKKDLEAFREAGGEIRIFVGVDMNVTSYEALMNLLSLADSLYVVHDENGQTFHSKIFSFSGPEEGLLIVGSHNLTSGGLWTSYESSVHIELDFNNPNHNQLQKSADTYFDRLTSFKNTVKPITTTAVIDELLENSYVEEEVKTRIQTHAQGTASAGRRKLFGASKRSKLPSLNPFPTVLPAPKAPRSNIPQSQIPPAPITLETSADATLWLETRKMTGGSRNILDLSKTSLLRSGDVKNTPYEHPDPDYMRGAVEFFGIAPEDTNSTKKITINFDGVDYFENTILFPAGKRANGTWRVQIHGVSESGDKITSAFSRKARSGYLLPEKSVCFSRIEADYYYLSVFDDNELPRFVSSSQITAYNGRSSRARLLGIF